MYQLKIPRRGLIRGVGLICFGSTAFSFAGDLSVSSVVPIVKLTLASRVNEKMTFATVTFDAEGFNKLSQGGWVSVNGVFLQVAPLKKQSFWYRADVPKAGAYKLEYLLSAGSTVIHHSLPDRPFFPKLPHLVSRSKGIIINFGGAPLKVNENISVNIGDPSEGAGRWREILRGTTDGNNLIIPSSELANVRLGPAQLMVSIFVRSPLSDGRFTYLQGNTDEATVNVID